VLPTDIGIVELSTGLRYNAAAGGAPGNLLIRPALGSYGFVIQKRWASRGSVSYVTGSHAFKAGFQLQHAKLPRGGWVNQDIYYMFRLGLPSAIFQYAAPDTRVSNMNADLGIFTQDQWTLKRLTLNVGVRYDYLNGSVPEQHLPAGRFVPARDFAGKANLPNWKDLNPRLGACQTVTCMCSRKTASAGRSRIRTLGSPELLYATRTASYRASASDRTAGTSRRKCNAKSAPGHR
jgi:hypothetical protein